MGGIDKRKIAIMAKLAVYDKKGFEKDVEAANHYFRHDFIYKKNMQMRFWLGVGCLILALFYFMYLMAVDGADIFTLNFQAEFVKLITFVLIVMFAYSALGAVIFTREFVLAQRRVNDYFELMQELDEVGTDADGRVTAAQMRGSSLRGSGIDGAANHEEDEDFLESEPYQRENDGRQYRFRNAEDVQFRNTNDPEFWEDE